jgi:hypothetical protein
MSGQVRLRPERRPEFMAELRDAIQSLPTKYGGADSEPLRIAFACYPKEDDPK